MGSESQLFPRTIGEHLAKMVKDRWPRNTAKMVERAWDVDPKTAKNIVEGHAGERTISKAIKAEGWELLNELGYALTGQSHDEWLEAKVAALIEENNRARQRIDTIRARRQTLEAQAASLAGLGDRSLAEHNSGEPSRSWAPTDGLGSEDADRPPLAAAKASRGRP